MANPNMNKAGRGAGGIGGANKPKVMLSFPHATEKLTMGMIFRFVNFSYNFSPYGSKAVIAKDLTAGHIALPLPENLTDNLDVNYETTDLGVALLGAEKGAATGKKIKEFLDSKQKEADGSDSGGGGGATDAAEYVVRSMAQVSGAVAGVLNLASGNVPNPFTTAIFKNVGIRQHNFTFRLTPETPEDSMMIARIITEFKFHALPGKAGSGSGAQGSSSFLTMPDEVEVGFFGTNALYGFARCVIKRVSVNYAPQNTPAFFKNSEGNSLVNAPQSVELQIELSEIEQLTRDQYATEAAAYDSSAVTSAPIARETVADAEQPGNKLTGAFAQNDQAAYDSSSGLTNDQPLDSTNDLQDDTLL